VNEAEDRAEDAERRRIAGRRLENLGWRLASSRWASLSTSRNLPKRLGIGVLGRQQQPVAE